MHEKGIGASKQDQVIHYAVALVDARDKRRIAWAQGDPKKYEAAKRKEHSAGLDLDRAVKQGRPP